MLAALVNAISILIGVGTIGWEAIDRFHKAMSVPAGKVVWVALIGIVVNADITISLKSGRCKKRMDS